MKYDDWYTNLPLYKKVNMQNEFRYEKWDGLTANQKFHIYNKMLPELHIDGPVEFYREEEWSE